MRLIRFESDVFDVTDSKQLKAGVPYVTTRTMLEHYSRAADGYLSVEAYPIQKAFDPAGDWNGKRVLIHRFGCAGDLLFITPLLREMKSRWPRLEIVFHCEQKYHWIFANNADVSACVSSPLIAETVEEFDAQISLEDATECSPLAKTHLATEVFAAAAGIQLSDPRSLYTPPPRMAESLAQRFPKTMKLRVGVSLTSNSVIRNYPYKSFIDVIGALMKSSIQVVILGKSETGVKSQPLFLDLAAERPQLSWEESIAFMKNCDLVLGPDSGAIHFAGAMGIPSLGLYGSFPADLRIPSQPATQAIQATGPCAPCFHHGRRHVNFPPYGPCALTGRCEILASIAPETVTAKILEMLGVSSSG